MKKEEFIKRYGKEAYEKWRQQKREWGRKHPEVTKTNHRREHRKGGENYERHLKYKITGLPHERELVRGKHQRYWAPYKQIIAQNSQIHHEWIPETANYRGVALVEKDQHMHGFIDVIQILEGEITLLREGEVRIGGL